MALRARRAGLALALAAETHVKDSTGHLWQVGEDALVRPGTNPIRLPRRTAFRAFWFGWYAQFPDTDLIK